MDLTFILVAVIFAHIVVGPKTPEVKTPDTPKEKIVKEVIVEPAKTVEPEDTYDANDYL